MTSHAKPWDARLAARLVAPFVGSDRVLPNHFTALRLVAGVAGALVFAAGSHPNLAAWLIVVSNFLDHTDGELARAGGKTSRFGHVFDLASDAVVTVGLFLGIGVGLSAGPLGGPAIAMGALAGVAVAAIFQLRNVMETRHGKTATQQPRFAGVEAEDVLYLLPLVTWLGGLQVFLFAAAVGAPLACAVVAWQYRRVMGPGA